MPDDHKYEDFEKDALLSILSETERLANVGGWEWDIVKDVWTFSDNWLRIHGCSKRHLKTSDLLPIAHPDDRKGIQKAFDRAITGGINYEIEHRIIRQDTSEERYVRSFGRPKLNGDGKAVKLYGAAQDITERRRIEEKLKTSEQKFRSLAENVPGLVLKYKLYPDGSDELVYISKSVEDIFEVSQEDALSNNKLLWDRIHRDDLEGYRKSIKTSAENFSMWERDHRIQLPDGRIKWLYTRGVPLQQDDDCIIWDTIALDITEQKKAEADLRRSEEKYRQLVIYAPTALYEIDFVNNRFVTVNDVAYKYTGYTEQELLEMVPSDILTSKSAQQFNERLQKIFSGEKVSPAVEYQIKKKDGGTLWAEMNVQMTYEGDTIKGATVVAHDITERKQAEDAIKKSEAKYRLIAENMAEIITTLDMDLNFTYVSPSVKKLRGFTVQESMEQTIDQIMTPESFQRLSEVFVEELNLEQSGTVDPDRTRIIELEEYKKDGSTIWVENTASFIRDSDKKPSGILVISRDITKRKKSEEALKLNYELLHIAGETAKFGGWSVDLEKNICTWSDAVADIHDVPHGYAPPVQEAINFYAPEWREKIAQCFSACAEDGIPYDERMEIITQKGKRVWVRATGRAVKNEKDKIIKVQGSFQDITELKRSEEALKASEKKYQSLFENAQVALFRNRLSDGKVLEINERYAKMAGYSNVEDCMAEFNAADAWVDPNGRKEFLKILQENGFISDYETEIIRKDGTNIWISFSATIFPEQGFLEGSIVEITERKRSEIERKKLQDQLNQALKMESVGRLAGGVAHDFNNMLSIILGNAEIIMEDMDQSNPLVTNLEEIYKAAERSANLTRQLLAFARKQTVAPKILNLNHVIDDMLKMLKRLIGEDIDLTWQPAQNLEPVKIDPSQIDQILANLCVNARGAIKSVGNVTIETDNISFDAAYCKEHAGFNPGDYVMMAVSDDGSGMDKKTLDNLFEPFFTTKDIGQGTGLGLATVYGIVKQNNGFINVYSEPGEGTTFKIYLPVHSGPAVSKQKDFKETSLRGNETILLVEDEKAILMMTKMMLERLGYTVLTASAPNEAISIVEAYDINKIHLLMTDVVMPEMNGRDLSKKLLNMCPGLKCLFMSGYTANVIAHHGVLDTGVQFINKPFSRQGLAKKVREVLDEAKGSA